VFVFLGNRDSLHYGPGNHAAYLTLPDELEGEELTAAVQAGWDANATPGSTPAWVAATDPVVAGMVSAHWSGIPVREPEVPPTLGGTDTLEGPSAEQ